MEESLLIEESMKERILQNIKKYYEGRKAWSKSTGG